MVDGPDNHKIDCMFFPCTQKENIQVYDLNSADDRELLVN